jgi:hypothetical protein
MLSHELQILAAKNNAVYEKVVELGECNLSNEFKNSITVVKVGYRLKEWIPPLMPYYYKLGIK